MGATMGKSGGNLLDSLPSTQGTLHIVMLGLDSAGKTTALYRLKFDQYLNTVPTIGFNCEKVRGTVGKAKGVQFLVWDVGGQEKLRPLWRSYTRCTDGIVFVVDSVDVERMEEAKMELMRTAKCPDNQGVPVLILANKQDLPGAREPKELEKFLGLHELTPLHSGPLTNQANFNQSISISSSSNSSSPSSQQQQQQQQQQQNQSTGAHTVEQNNITTTNTTTTTAPNTPTTLNNSNIGSNNTGSTISQMLTTTTTTSNISTKSKESNDIKNNDYISNTDQTSSYNQSGTISSHINITSHTNYNQNFKGWYIQPACAITGEGLQEGLDALYDMIVKKRKMNKTNKKKR